MLSLVPLHDQGLQSTSQDHQLRGSMHALPMPKVDTRIWDRLAENVRRSGTAAIRRALDDKLYPVPNVSGAKGRLPTASPWFPHYSLSSSCL